MPEHDQNVLKLPKIDYSAIRKTAILLPVSILGCFEIGTEAFYEKFIACCACRHMAFY